MASTGKRKRNHSDRSSKTTLDLDRHATDPGMDFGTGNAVLFSRGTEYDSRGYTIKAHEAVLQRAPEAARALEPGGKGLIRLAQDRARMRVKGEREHSEGRKGTNGVTRTTGSTIVDSDIGFVDDDDLEFVSEGRSEGPWVDRYVYLCTRLECNILGYLPALRAHVLHCAITYYALLSMR